MGWSFKLAIHVFLRLVVHVFLNPTLIRLCTVSINLVHVDKQFSSSQLRMITVQNLEVGR